MMTLLLSIWAIGLIFMIAAAVYASRPGELENADPVLVAIAYMFWPVSLMVVYIHTSMDAAGRDHRHLPARAIPIR
jgi:hypothetical protein